MLRALGAVVDLRPAIAFEPAREADAIGRAIRRLAEYDWLIFTSVPGVQFFMRAREVHAPGAPLSASIGAIGPGTAAELEQFGHPPTLVADETCSEGLARALEQRVQAGERVLVVRPETARPLVVDALREHGACPDPVAFYRNVGAPDLAGIVEDLCENRFDAVLLSSPSTLSRLLDGNRREQVLESLRRSRAVAIGPVTAEAMERVGLQPAAVAGAPTDEAIARCIGMLFCL